MSSYENDIELETGTGNNGTSAEEASTSGENGMKFHEILPNSKQTRASIPHQMKNGVQYAVANEKGKISKSKQHGLYHIESNRVVPISSNGNLSFQKHL